MTAQKPAGSNIGISWAEASANIAAVQAALRRPPTEEPTMTLTEFLLARIAERQAKAQAVIDSHEMWGWGSYTASAGMYQEPVSEFAEIVSPEWVIAECEATRRTVEHCADDLTNKHRDVYVLEFLALPYADHPDYDEAWRP